MQTIKEFERLSDWINKHSKIKTNKLNNGASKENFDSIESIIGEVLPIEFRELYSKYDGEIDLKFDPIFFGEKFLSSSEIITYFEFPKSLIKPKERYIRNPEKTEAIINEIKDVLIDYLNKVEIQKVSWIEILKRQLLKILGISIVKNKNWSKINISFGERSVKGPGFQFDGHEYQDFPEISEELSSQLFTLGSKLYNEEKEGYNWDDIDLVIYKSGKLDIVRTDYDWDNEIQFKSIPEKAIKRKYFNIKWVPIFFDHAGNYIGIDLDPDTEGHKGQVIIFGTDENIAYALAENLTDFFRKLNLATESFKDNESTFPLLLKKYHIHSILPELLKIK